VESLPYIRGENRAGKNQKNMKKQVDKLAGKKYAPGRLID
jgi:hypothetical protein